MIHYLSINHAKSVSDKSFGMILKKNSEGLFFRTRFGIHTFFMKKPIDILILDSLDKVVRIKPNLKPNKIFVWDFKFDKIVELPEGSVNKLKIKVGDEIKY